MEIWLPSIARHTGPYRTWHCLDCDNSLSFVRPQQEGSIARILRQERAIVEGLHQKLDRLSALQTSCAGVHSLLHHPTLQHIKFLRWTVRLYDRGCKLIEQRVFHVIWAMGTDAEWRELFMNIGKNPWEIKRRPVPDEPEAGADPSPNTGNNWHSNGTISTNSMSAVRTRKMSVGREIDWLHPMSDGPWYICCPT